jgi:DNA modification methylase
MKYRIKETIDCNNVSTFKVQEKILWWWVDDIQWRSKDEAEHCVRSLQTKEVKYHTVEQRAENNNIKEFEI